MRREARIKAMQILYIVDFHKICVEEATSMVFEEEIDELAVELAKRCYARLEEIDELISTTLVNYTLDRLNLIDKAIIRLAVSEMLSDEPREVIINEALEITKQYSDLGDHKATSFNNRLLDNIHKKLK
jgi:transcription antitermination factor NusB